MTWDDYVHPLFGLAPKTFLGGFDSLVQLAHQDDREHLKQAVVATLERDEPYDTEYRVVWPDGTVRVLASRGKVYRDSAGKPMRMTGVFWDVTEQKGAKREIQELNEALERRVAERTAQFEEANKELESFSYSVSHDLRAPLRHIHGYVEMLREATVGQLSEKVQRYLKTITDASVEMGQLIDDLLAFSRMGRNEMAGESAVQLDALVQETIRGLEMATTGRNIVWRAAPLPQVVGDPSMLRQVFANLVGNAIKYSRMRDPAQIEIGCAGEEEGRIILFVRDNGAGFDMKYAQKLFGVFQRLHRPEEFEGTGIGLAIVRRILSRHGGRVWADSALNQGATFYFTLKGASI
jgi:PAS domain S-box-containing protein